MGLQTRGEKVVVECGDGGWGGGRGDVAKLWVWNDFQFLKPSLHLSYSNPVR